jgi:hypothetical protein
MHEVILFETDSWGQDDADGLAEVLDDMAAEGHRLVQCQAMAGGSLGGHATNHALWLIFRRGNWTFTARRWLYAIIRPVRRRPETRATGSLN